MAIRLLFLVCFITHTGTQDLPTEITTSLLSLVSEESTLRARLADEVDLLEKELARIKASRTNVSCGCPSSMAPMAFSVTLKDNIATLGKEQAIVYDELTRFGYDLSTRATVMLSTENRIPPSPVPYRRLTTDSIVPIICMHRA